MHYGAWVRASVLAVVVFALLAAAAATALLHLTDLAAFLAIAFCVAWFPLLRMTSLRVGRGVQVGVYLCAGALLVFSIGRLTALPGSISFGFLLGTIGAMLVVAGAIERLARRAHA